MEEHLKHKEHIKKAKQLKGKSSKKAAAKEVDNDKDHHKSEKTEQVLQVLTKILKRQEMPKFAIFSRLDKNLLKLMLIRATQLTDEDIPGYMLKYFHPEKEEEENKSAQQSQVAGGDGCLAEEAEHKIEMFE